MDEARRTNILLEDMLSKFDAFGEGLCDIRKIVQKHDERFDQLEGRLDRVEGRLDHLEKTNSQEHHLMMQMIKELHEEQVNIKRAL